MKVTFDTKGIEWILQIFGMTLSVDGFIVYEATQQKVLSKEGLEMKIEQFSLTKDDLTLCKSIE